MGGGGEEVDRSDAGDAAAQRRLDLGEDWIRGRIGVGEDRIWGGNAGVLGAGIAGGGGCGSHAGRRIGWGLVRPLRGLMGIRSDLQWHLGCDPALNNAGLGQERPTR